MPVFIIYFSSQADKDGKWISEKIFIEGIKSLAACCL